MDTWSEDKALKTLKEDMNTLMVRSFARKICCVELPFYQRTTIPAQNPLLLPPVASFTTSEQSISTTRADSLTVEVFRENATNAVPAAPLRAF